MVGTKMCVVSWGSGGGTVEVVKDGMCLFVSEGYYAEFKVSVSKFSLSLSLSRCRQFTVNSLSLPLSRTVRRSLWYFAKFLCQ